MQNLEEFKEYSDILDTDFSDWKDDFFSENVTLSDVENKLQSQHLIKNLQSTNNRTGTQSGIFPTYREVSCRGNVSTSKWKKIKLTNLCTVNTSHDLNLPQEQKSPNFSQNKTTPCIRKYPDDHSDSEDFCAPNKKRKKTEIQSVKPDKAFTPTDVPANLVYNQTDSIPVIEETSKSQSEMFISSQGSKMSISQGSQKMKTAGSQVTPDSQISLSPTVITNSQESLGREIMSISINENNISNTTNQCETHINVKNSNTNQNVNSQKLNVYHQKDDTISNKEMKAGFPGKNIFTEKFSCSVSDTFCIKSDRWCNKERRKHWSIRKRELQVAKRENELDIREKLLDVREADVQKREDILKARERRYLSHKAKIKNMLQNPENITKKLKKRLCVLEDDTNSFSARPIKGFELVHVSKIK